MITPVILHLGLYHTFDTSHVRFITLNVIKRDPCGGNWDKKILQQETLWIEQLNATQSPDINEVLSYMPFL